MNASAKAVWALMLFSSFVYTGLAYAMVEGFIPFEFPDSEDANIFALSLGVVSLSLFALAAVLPGRLVKTPLLTKQILRFACIESVGLLGLIYVLQTGDFNRGAFFFAASVLGLLVAFPKDEEKSY